MHYTSIEQSKKLLELGLNPDTADMYYFLDPTPVGNIYIPSLIIIEKHLKSRMPEYDKGDIPCWSLGVLLELIPHTGFDGIELNNYNDDKTIWTAIFHWRTDSTPIRIADTPLDAVYEVVVWLLENGYIKTEKK